MSETIAVRPTPRQIDNLIARYAALQADVVKASAVTATAKAAADVVKEQLVAMVEAFGVKHAEKSKKLQGLRNWATTTTGTLTSVDDVAVEKFRAKLDEMELPEISGKLFSERVTYQLVDGPEEVLRTVDVKGSVLTKLVKLVKGCFVVKSKAPSLKVNVAEMETGK